MSSVGEPDPYAVALRAALHARPEEEQAWLEGTSFLSNTLVFQNYDICFQKAPY